MNCPQQNDLCYCCRLPGLAAVAAAARNEGTMAERIVRIQNEAAFDRALQAARGTYACHVCGRADPHRHDEVSYAIRVELDTKLVEAVPNLLHLSRITELLNALVAAARAEGAAENANLRERLLAANSLLRSAYQIAKRELQVPNSTNWDAFALQLSKELALQHEITGPMYGARAPSSGTEARP